MVAERGMESETFFKGRENTVYLYVGGNDRAEGGKTDDMRQRIKHC